MIRALFKLVKWVMIAIAGLLVIGWLAYDPDRANEAGTVASDPLRMARYDCSSAIEARLNDPKSAEWGDYLSWPTRVTDDVLTVTGTIRARNGFNALMLAEFTCTMMRNAEGRWTVQDVRQTSP